MRQALVAVFEEPERDQPSFVKGKIRDVLALLALGSVLVFSVAVSGVATKVLTPILDALQPRPGRRGRSWWCWRSRVGMAANTRPLLRLLPPPRRARRPHALPLVGCPARRRRLRGPQAGLDAAAEVDRQLRRLPGLRHRADPRGLDQLLLPRRGVRRRLGAHLARGPRRPRGAHRGRADRRGPEDRPRRGSGRRTRLVVARSPPPPRRRPPSPPAPPRCSGWSRSSAAAADPASSASGARRSGSRAARWASRRTRGRVAARHALSGGGATLLGRAECSWTTAPVTRASRRPQAGRCGLSTGPRTRRA